MKKLTLLLILACVLATASCGARSETVTSVSPSASPTPTTYPKKTITPDQIETFSYSTGEYGIYDEYSVSRDDLTARMLLHDFYKPEIEITQSWTPEKWNAFTEDLLACGIADWKKSYYDEAYYTGELNYEGGWDLTVTGESVFIDVEGGESPDDGQFSSVLREYFYWPTPEDDTNAEPVVLMAEAPLPAPDQGEWYEWGKAGTFTLNPNGFLYYIEDQNLLIREIDSILYVSGLDGNDKQVITREGCQYDFNYFDGWMFYKKWDKGIWKLRPDGTCDQFVADIDEENIYIYNKSFYYFDYDRDQFCCYTMEDKTKETIYLPGYKVGPYLFENGFLYYGAVNPDNNVSYRLSIYRYDIETRQAVELTKRSIGDFAVRDRMLYYLDDGLMRTDGNITEKVKSSIGYYFNLYRNYLMYINYKSDWTCVLYALNLDTGMEYELFELPVPFGSNRSDIYVMENTVFLYNAQNESSPVFRITFENGTARLWKLNGLAAQ